MTSFQTKTIDKIRHIGGSIYYASDKSWTDQHGNRVSVPSEDFRTEGRVGWPTIKSLVDLGRLVNRAGNEYALTKSV